MACLGKPYYDFVNTEAPARLDICCFQAHFFDHYKDLERGKWVEIDGWRDLQAAKDEILRAVERFEESPEKPNFCGSACLRGRPNRILGPYCPMDAAKE